MIGQALKGIIVRLVALTNKCLSSYENTAELMIIQATTFNLLLCHSICAQITLLIQGGLALSFFFLCSLSWKAEANLKATDDS